MALLRESAWSRIEPEREPRFEFGKNWRSFVATVDDERVEAARLSLVELLGTDDLTGSSFLDAGCGSGLFSLAATRLGATVHSFDYDADSVAASGELKRRYAPDAGGWRIEQGSVLDREYLSSLGSFDTVYSWGVLHHTGSMWKAMENVSKLVRPGGTLAISIYNDQGRASDRWRKVKLAYSRGSRPLRIALLGLSAIRLYARSVLSHLVRNVSPTRLTREARSRPRGMSRWHDLVDWVGGYPFEVAKPEEVFNFLCSDRGYELAILKTCGGGLGCNEFVLRKRTAQPR